MRDILVDQATMMAVRRLEGDVPVKDARLPEGDVLALENLMQAILFYDNTLYLDCAGFKSRKRTHKNFERLCTITLENENYLDLLDEVNHISDDLIPCIDKGQFTDELLSDFFRALEMDIRFLWTKKGSLYYLTQSIADAHVGNNRGHYPTVLNMLFSELQDGAHIEEINDRCPLLYDSCGQIVNKQYKLTDDRGIVCGSKISYQTDVMFQGINAMMFRTILDSMVGKELKTCSVLYPTRSVLQWNALEKACKGVENPQEDYLDIHQNLPLIGPWMALQNQYGRQRFIEMAFDLREEPEFVQIRSYLDEIYDMMDRGKTTRDKDLATILTAYEQQMHMIREKYQVAKDRDITFPSVIRYMKKGSEIIPKLFPHPFSMELEETDYTPDEKSSYALWHRWLSRDLKEIKKLGNAYDAVTAKVDLEYEAELAYLKVEDPDEIKQQKWWRSIL